MPGWASGTASLVAVVIAGVAFWSNHAFRIRDALMSLLARFEAGHFHVRMWRMEQVTRGEDESGEPRDAWSIVPLTISALKESLDGQVEEKAYRIDQALALDWSTERADMQEAYFFALRVHAWLTSSYLRRFSTTRMARQLNDTFGYQLLSTFLDHRLVACRLLPNPEYRVPEAHRAAYYATHYGLFDPAYTTLVNILTDDLLRDGNTQPGRIQEVISNKKQALDRHLAGLSPQPASG